MQLRMKTPMTRLFLIVLLLAPIAAHAITPGDPAPQIIGTSMADGHEVKLSDLRGKVVYLDFWASWCAPCKVALPELEKMHEELASAGLEVVGVNLDEEEVHARKAADAGGVHYTLLRGVDQKSIEAYALMKMPAAYLIDRDGVVRYSYQGFSEKGFAGVRPLVDSLVRTGDCAPCVRPGEK